MKKTTRRWINRGVAQKTIALLILLLTAGCLLTGCGKPSDFEGSRSSNGIGFWMEYAILDREETADLSLEEGEQLQVSIKHTVGNADITVGRVGKEPIYKGDAQTNADFVVTIPETGTYRISIKGHQAKGSVSFTRIPAGTEPVSAQEP